MPSHFMPLKILVYEGRDDPKKHLNNYKTHMSLRDTLPVLKCRPFYLTPSGVVEVWYSRIPGRSIRGWPDLKKAFLNEYLVKKDREALI